MESTSDDQCNCVDDVALMPPPPPLPTTQPHRIIGRFGVAFVSPCPRRSLFYIPHTMTPYKCCHPRCDKMTTTVMCLEHYPAIEHARDVHWACTAMRLLYTVVANLRSIYEPDVATTTLQRRNTMELEKAMSLFFDFLWFNRDTLLVFAHDSGNMRRLYVEFATDLASTSLTCANRFRNRHVWVLHFPDYDIVV